MPVTLDSVGYIIREVIVGEQAKFASRFGVPSDVSSQLCNANSVLTNESHDFITRIVEIWVLQNVGEATIGSLSNLMKDMKLSALEEAISGMGNFETQIILPTTEEPQPSPSTHAANFNESTKREERLLRAKEWEKYEVQEYLGSGSFGFVFKIKKKEDTMPTALKIVIDRESNLPSDAEASKIIQANKEIQAMKALRGHINVVKLLHCDVLYPNPNANHLLKAYYDLVGLRKMNDSTPPAQTTNVVARYNMYLELSLTLHTVLIEMELCGPTLRNWLNSDDTKTQKQNILEKFAWRQFNIAQCIIDGLKYLHRKHIMHGDLNPNNIYFSYKVTGEFTNHVKIGDFGFSEEISGPPTKLIPRKHHGTKPYEEQDDGLCGKQSDLYPLGLILWEVFDDIQYKDIKRRFEDLTIDNRHKSLIKQNPWVTNLVDTIFNLTYRNKEKRTKSIDDIKLEFKSQSQESSGSESLGIC